MAIKRDDFPLPDVDDPLTAGYFAGAARGELVIPRCETCGEYVWYPQTACPNDEGSLMWSPVSGRGTLFTWAIVRRAFLPAFADRVPFVTALVALAESPAIRLCTYIVGTPAEDLVADAPVAVTFRPLEFTTVPGKSVIVPMFAVVES